MRITIAPHWPGWPGTEPEQELLQDFMHLFSGE